MKELVEIIAKELVDYPDKVVVHEIIRDNQIVFELSVAPEDMGKIIGKKGRIVRAIRTFVGAAAVKERKRVTIEII